MIQSIDINNFGFLDCYRDRIYDPALGRFLSEDPIGFRSGDTNHYRYVMNNPISLRDPLGLAAWPWDIVDEAASHPNSSTGNDSSGNAFKHCYASCMLSAEYGSSIASALGSGFELTQPQQSEFSGQMDASNNATGVGLGGTAGQSCFPDSPKVSSGASCEAKCGAAPLIYSPM